MTQELLSGKKADSLELINRESCTRLAKALFDRERAGKFIFLSAEAGILPMFEDYYKTKLEAEEFLKENAGLHKICVVRPGLVWHRQDRPWLIPFGLAADVLSKVSGSKTGSPSTNLSTLSDTICSEVMKEQKQQFKLIRASQMTSCSL